MTGGDATGSEAPDRDTPDRDTPGRETPGREAADPGNAAWERTGDTPGASATDAFETRQATETDLDAIMRIETGVFAGDAWSRELMHGELTGDYRHYRVAAAGGRIVGYAGLLALGSDGDIQTIAVAPEARGTGLGRRLMDELLDEAGRRNVRQVFLEVRADNPVARGLYASLGFQEAGIRPRYYQPDDVDAVVMRLDLRERRRGAGGVP